LDGRWTMVLEKRVHGWIVVHEHVSAPLGGS
jgi:ketosteroid isomerase-like protein